MGVLQFGAREASQADEAPQECPYTALRPWLVQRIVSIARDADIAEDVSQEALLRLALEIRAGRTPDNIRAWLVRVGFNLVMSNARRSQVARRRSHELLADGARSLPEERAIEAERSASMWRALAEVAPRDQRMVAMAASGHSGAEIAREVGSSDAAIRTRLHRLRTRLRARLAALEAA